MIPEHATVAGHGNRVRNPGYAEDLGNIFSLANIDPHFDPMVVEFRLDGRIRIRHGIHLPARWSAWAGKVKEYELAGPLGTSKQLGEVRRQLAN